MSKTRTFYYHFKRFNFWLIFNLLYTYMIICCAIKYSYCFHWIQFHILIILMILSWGLWFYKHFIKQTLAIINNESIKIDHCHPLPWKDITNAEERFVRCCFRRLKIIVLNTKPNITYSYNFLQKHNGPFTPFSLPLYPVITKEESEELKRIISSKIPYTSLPEEEKIMPNKEETEQLAERIHIIWSRWFLHYSKNATPKNMRRWTRLAHTNYKDLPEEEKQKDRDILNELFGNKIK